MIGETYILWCEHKIAGQYVNVSTSMKLTIILSPPHQILVPDTPMVNDETGKYHYDYLTTNSGKHKVIFTAVDGSRITKEELRFTVE